MKTKLFATALALAAASAFAANVMRGEVAPRSSAAKSVAHAHNHDGAARCAIRINEFGHAVCNCPPLAYPPEARDCAPASACLCDPGTIANGFCGCQPH
jgi:hypothetical protein